MKLFQINFKRLVILLLPTFLRTERFRVLLNIASYALANLHYDFLRNRDANINRVVRNGQVCRLQGLLNDELDNAARRITIDEGETAGDWLFIYDEADENRQLIIEHENPGEKMLTLYHEGKIIENAAVFVVRVPWNDKNADFDNRLKSLLNEYKLLSKKYTIIR